MTSNQRYPRRDYALGEYLMTLRSRTQLTQAELAARIGVHRRSVQKWESGETYPTAERLRALIALLLDLGVFAPDQELAEASDLWQRVRASAPQQLPFFDTVWFNRLLVNRQTPAANGAPAQTTVDQTATQPAQELRRTLVARDLPLPSTPLIGRDTELRTIASLLDNPDCRLLTLLGPGGIGKTRLALAAAQHVAARDGVVFVPLAAVLTPEQMVTAIGDALQLSFGGQADPTVYLFDYLRTRQLLLLLDDFEHLADGADLVSALLQAAPQLTILVTSRARLNLQAEWLLAVEGLAYPTVDEQSAGGAQDSTPLAHYSAIQLFVQRARQVQPEFSVTEATLALIARICQQVAGIPLALELAAANLRSLPLAEIERQIVAHLDVLATSLRDVPPRHRSLRAVFEHSWNLLDRAEQVLLRRLSVFRGSWDQAAVYAICAQIARQAGEGQSHYRFSPLELMALVDKSLVRRGPGAEQTPNAVRYLLLEPIREYAREQLAASGEAALLQGAHATHYLALAEATMAHWGGPLTDAAITRLDQERDNLRGALQWAATGGDSTLGFQLAGALLKFWRRRGLYSEGRSWLEGLLALGAEQLDAKAQAARLRAVQGAAWLASDQHDYERATELFEQGRELRRALGQQEDATNLQVNAALQARALGQYAQAAAHLEAVLAQQRALDNRGSFGAFGLGLSLFLLGLVQREQGNFARARALYEECVQLHRALGDREGVAVGLLGLSDIARDQGNIAQIRQYGMESLALLQELEIKWAIGFALNNLAWAAYLANDLPLAAAHINDSVARFRGQQANGSLAEVLITLGQILQAQGHTSAAHAALTEALQLGWEVGPRLMVAQALEALAGLAVQTNGARTGAAGVEPQAAQLAVDKLAAAAALRAQMGAPLWPARQAAVEHTQQQLRATLGPAAFAAAWMQAGSLSFAQLQERIPSMAALPAHPIVETADPAGSIAPRPTPRIQWGLAQDTPVLYGRAAELATLTQWVLNDQCRVISLVGLGGIGKTSLAITAARQLAPHFAAVIFRSLGEAPPITDLLDQLIRGIKAEQRAISTQTTDPLSLLIDLLRQERCLLILDNLETILQPGMAETTYLAGYEGYGTLLKAIGATAHQSCLILTSRERPHELAALEGPRTPVRSLQLRGLADAACQAILADQDLLSAAEDAATLAHHYGGNPLALKLVADPIRALFGGNLAAFLSEGTLFFNGVGQLLAQQVGRAAPLEQTLLTWLAIVRTPTTLDQLMAELAGITVQTLTRTVLLTALHSLWRRNLVELGQTHLTFGLQRVVLEYLSEALIEHILAEITGKTFDQIRRYPLIQATAPDHVRRSQERLIAVPLLERLIKAVDGRERAERLLLALLDSWRSPAAAEPSSEPGYGPGNVVNLLRLVRGHLRGVNLARLALRQVYLQGVEAQDSSLAQAAVRDNVFTEAFGIVHAVASTRSGSYWAASNVNGAVQVWREQGRTSHLSIPAHTKQVKTLAFSPNEQILATGSWDCTVKLWDTQRGALVCTLAGHTDYVQDVTFAPDGHQLASASDDQTVRIWDVATGACLRTIQAHTDNAYGVVWSADGKWVASCGFDQRLHLWDVTSGARVQTFTGHTRPVSKLVFSPDMRLLASGGFDRTVRIWDVASGECIQLFTGHESTVMAIAWSPDGRTIATCSYDGTVRLWELDQTTAQRILTGHGASINALVFTANGKLLLSGSDDQTVRVWDVASGWCERVIAGYGLFCFGLVWSPDGRSLLSANSDTTLTLWNVADGTVRLTLRGHTHTVYGVAWSPDGRWLASSGYDQTVRLWDAENGVCVRVIAAHTDTVYRVVCWSPDGRWLASAGRDQAVRIWDITTGNEHWVGRGHTGPINEVVWSPDGQRLASCGEDRTVRLWRAADGALLQTLTGHESSVAGVAWSPDGRRLASCGGGGATGELLLWDAERGERVKTLTGPDSVVSRVVWSRDNQRLFSGGMSGAIYWWDVASGANLHTRQGHQSWLRSLSVSPDGELLVSSGEDGLIHLWDTARAEIIRTLRIDRPYERMEITGLTGITNAQRATLLALGAVEHRA